MTSESRYKNLNDTLQNLLAYRESLLETIEKGHPDDGAFAAQVLLSVDKHIEFIQNMIQAFDIMKEDEECPIESTTCGMDVDKKLSEEKNKELMQHGLDNLGDLL